MTATRPARPELTIVDATVRDLLEKHLLRLLADLIASDSQTPPGDCRAAAEVCSRWLDAEGIEHAVVGVDERLPNVVAKLAGGSEQGELCLNAHLDTVSHGDRGAWKTDPFVATRVGEHVAGLGAANCKGSVAGLLVATLALARANLDLRGGVTLSLVADEESLGARGTGYLIESGAISPRHFLAAGPTSNTLIHAERGLLWVEVEVLGVAAHGATPAAGRNAVAGAARIMLELEDTLQPRLDQRTATNLPASSMNVGVIDGGESPNMVAPSCSFTLDRRLVPGETPAEALAEIAEICERAAARHGLEVDVRATRSVPPYEADPNSRLAGAVADGCRWVGLEPRAGEAIAISDARFVAESDVDVVGFGAGDGRASHGPNESVAVDELVNATRVFALAGAALLTEGET